MEPLLNKIISKTKKFVLPLFFIIVGIWTLPWPISLPRAGLDPSWHIGISMAFLENLQFGKDIVFAYGPLGFLWRPFLINYNLWSLSLFFSFFTHFLFIGSIFLLLKKLSARWYHYIALITILIFAIPPIEYKLGIIVLIFLYVLILSTESRGKDLVGLVFMGSLLSIATLIKFNAFFMSISIILIFLVCMLAKKNVKYGAYLMLSYFIFLISLWLVSGQNVANFIRYLHNGIELSHGYTDAMAISGQNWQVFIGLISILSVLVLFMYSVRENKRNILLFLLLNLGILFMAFKHGFVRHDAHVLFFFRVYLLFFGLLLIITLQEIKIREFDYRNHADIFLNIFMIIILFFSMCPVAPSILNDNIMTKSPSYSLAGDLLTNPTSFRETVESQKERIRKKYPLDQQTIKYIDEKTVDVFPWDIALCWAYDFNWSPRPVFQSYTAYTQHLDKINSQHFMENSSPQAILYAYKSIDGRYPLFDEPTTFRTILCDYTYLNKSGEFLLLTHNPKAKNCGFEENLGTINSEIGQLVSIPEYNEGYVFGHIELEYSFIGKIMKIIYKPYPVYMQFKFKDGTYSQNFRFIPDTAKNGISLSQYVGNLDDLTSIFQGQIINDIDGIVIETDNPAHYSKHVTVKFVGVPANVSVKSGYRFVYLFKPIRIHPQQPFISDVGVINGESRPVIYEHPLPSDKNVISFENISVPKNASLKFSIALDSQVWSPDKGDGVLFEIYIKENESEQQIFSKYIDPKNNPEDRKWNDFEVDLSSYANKNVTILFATSAGPKNNSRYDWAWWGNPILLEN